MCAVTAVDNRWMRCDIKAISLLANILLRQQAVEADCAEAVMLRDGFLTEGAASNIFVVKDGVLLVPPPSNLMLTGITYDLVLELAAANGIPHQVRNISEAELRSSRRTVDDLIDQGNHAYCETGWRGGRRGRAGALARRMDALYQIFKQQVMRA